MTPTKKNITTETKYNLYAKISASYDINDKIAWLLAYAFIYEVSVLADFEVLGTIAFLLTIYSGVLIPIWLFLIPKSAKNHMIRDAYKFAINTIKGD